MARRFLRVASIALAGVAGFGFLLGGFFMLMAIETWNGPGMAGILAWFALIVWAVSALVARFAIWSGRARFKSAAISLTVAGTIAGYGAIIYFGHDQAVFVALAVVTVIILMSITAAVAISLWQHRPTDTGTSDSN